MKMVIDISHNLYDAVFLGHDLTNIAWHELYKAVKNGKTFPKHGDLIDRDAYEKVRKPRGITDDGWNECAEAKAIHDAPTIIEADGEGYE